MLALVDARCHGVFACGEGFFRTHPAQVGTVSPAGACTASCARCAASIGALPSSRCAPISASQRPKFLVGGCSPFCRVRSDESSVCPRYRSVDNSKLDGYNRQFAVSHAKHHIKHSSSEQLRFLQAYPVARRALRRSRHPWLHSSTPNHRPSA